MFNREWGKKHKEAAKQQMDKVLSAVLDRSDLTPEQKAKITEDVAAEHKEREKEPA